MKLGNVSLLIDSLNPRKSIDEEEYRNLKLVRSNTQKIVFVFIINVNAERGLWESFFLNFSWAFLIASYSKNVSKNEKLCFHTFINHAASYLWGHSKFHSYYDHHHYHYYYYDSILKSYSDFTLTDSTKAYVMQPKC